jgi:hypothetical protein
MKKETLNAGFARVQMSTSESVRKWKLSFDLCRDRILPREEGRGEEREREREEERGRSNESIINAKNELLALIIRSQMHN